MTSPARRSSSAALASASGRTLHRESVVRRPSCGQGDQFARLGQGADEGADDRQLAQREHRHRQADSRPPMRPTTTTLPPLPSDALGEIERVLSEPTKSMAAAMAPDLDLSRSPRASAAAGSIAAAAPVDERRLALGGMRYRRRRRRLASSPGRARAPSGRRRRGRRSAAARCFGSRSCALRERADRR